MDSFLERQKVLQLTQEEFQNLDRHITTKKTELEFKNFSTEKSSGLNSFYANLPII